MTADVFKYAEEMVKSYKMSRVDNDWTWEDIREFQTFLTGKEAEMVSIDGYIGSRAHRATIDLIQLTASALYFLTDLGWSEEEHDPSEILGSWFE